MRSWLVLTFLLVSPFITNASDPLVLSCSDDCDFETPEEWSLLKWFKERESLTLKPGGSYRIRYHNENNMRRSGLTGQDDEFVLHQTRLWLDGNLTEDLAFHGEMLDAASFGETFRPRGNEVNRADLYQLDVDAKVADYGSGTLTARLGRQEIRLGSARLLMAPIWANRRRAHDGVRMMWRDCDWDVDAFWVRPIFRDAAHFTAFDATNHFQQLYGVFGTYKGYEQSTLELYWLAYDIERGAGAPGGRYDTFGSRRYGEANGLLYEVEGGLQLGTNPDDSSHTAGFVTAGAGQKFEETWWEPEVWLFYDYASGSSTTGNGFHTYVQRAHYYLGFMDLFGRRNLQDINLRITTKPIEKLTFLVWYHYFMLANGRDVPYNLSMNPFAGLSAGDAGSKDLGHELDLVLTYQLNEQTQFRVGYSHFWSGAFYDKTPGVPTNVDANFFYTHFQYQF
ncbi:MAG: hypothetical protein CMJ78_22590 [Planctomycetaceae bacterium]|nr:hypothetical protein [Planctomycetaceae bacterium]